MSGSREIKSPPGNEIVIIGIIVPVEWDDKGTPVSTAVSTYSEVEYLIDGGNKNGMELQKLCRQKVEMSGILGAFKGDRQIITVKNYRKLRYDASLDSGNGKTLIPRK